MKLTAVHNLGTLSSMPSTGENKDNENSAKKPSSSGTSGDSPDRLPKPKKKRLMANFDQERQEEIRSANRLAARQSRDRKRKITQDLSTTLKTLMEENQLLQNQHKALLAWIAEIKNSQLQSAIMNATTQTISTNMLNNIQILRAANQQQQVNEQQQIDNAARQLLVQQQLANQTQSQNQQQVNNSTNMLNSIPQMVGAANQQQQVNEQQRVGHAAHQLLVQQQLANQTQSQNQQQINNSLQERIIDGLLRTVVAEQPATSMVQAPVQPNENPVSLPPLPPLGLSIPLQSGIGRVAAGPATPNTTSFAQQNLSPLNPYLTLNNLNWLSQMGLRAILPNQGVNQAPASSDSQGPQHNENDNDETKPRGI